jgi:F0F1-type ATP synthase assembly protein I
MSKRRASTRLAGLGFELAAAVAGFALVGYWVGKYYGNPALGLLIGSLLGLVGGMYNLFRTTLASQRRLTDQEQKTDSDSDA